jgi:LSD1 subclass zinc finger protein
MEEKISSTLNSVGCKSCGAILKFSPGTNNLKCAFCGAENEIKSTSSTTETIQELDFHAHLNEVASNKQSTQEVSTVRCTGCSAVTSLRPNVTSDECAFCGTALVLTSAEITTTIKPKSVLPFKVDEKNAKESFKKWLGTLWFAPGGLKKYAYTDHKLHGMYIPYWTYDTDVATSYSGQRGIHRQETEHYTENGQSRTRTRTVTDWYSASGHVHNNFDDVLVNASNSLPRDYADALEPWDMENLVSFNEQYLTGFQTESYQIGLKDGFDHAKEKMQSTIDNTIRNDIGGDDQRINSKDSEYNNITFKHTLLPIWLSAYKYNGKAYKFLVNGRTGETKGDRPYSVGKIAGAIITGILVIVAFAQLGAVGGIIALAIFLGLLFGVFK